MSEALQKILAAVEAHTDKPARKSGDSYRVLCPYHGGKHHNLSITDGDDRALLHCHSHGCDPLLIMESIGLSIQDIYHQQLTPREQLRHKAVINDREIRAALEIELIILLQWLSASNKVLFPCDEEVDRERVMKSFSMVLNACNHYIKEGVK